MFPLLTEEVRGDLDADCVALQWICCKGPKLRLYAVSGGA